MSADPRLAGQTIKSARRRLAQLFAEAGLDTTELDARLLVGGALGLDLTALIANGDRPLTEADATRIAAFAERRLAGEPVVRILAEAEFWGLPLKLSPDTLVPRPDTETLVEAALAFARQRPLSVAPLRVADIGTGSGAILLALLSEWPDASGVASDVSAAALAMAKANAVRLGLSDRICFVESDYLAALDGAFDLIVSNPPYISSGEIASLAREVRDHEPHLALDGGADGLAAYRILARGSASRLAPGGALMVEVGHDQADEVARLMAASGLAVTMPFHRDLAGIARVVGARKSHEK